MMIRALCGYCPLCVIAVILLDQLGLHDALWLKPHERFYSVFMALIDGFAVGTIGPLDGVKLPSTCESPVILD